MCAGALSGIFLEGGGSKSKMTLILAKYAHFQMLKIFLFMKQFPKLNGRIAVISLISEI